MVHALEEAWRVLKPDGLLIDLRPAMEHRRVGIMTSQGKQQLGVMRERFADDIVANRAIARAVRRGLFRRVRRDRVECLRTMDTLKEFRRWLADYVSLDKLPPHVRLTERIEAALEENDEPAKIFVDGPLDLTVLARCDTR